MEGLLTQPSLDQHNPLPTPPSTQPLIHPSTQPNTSKYIPHKELLMSRKAVGMLSELAGFLNMRHKTSGILSPHSPGLKVHKRTKGLDTLVCSSNPKISELPQDTLGSLKENDANPTSSGQEFPCHPRKWHSPEKPTGSSFLQVTPRSQTSSQNIPREPLSKLSPLGFSPPLPMKLHLISKALPPAPHLPLSGEESHPLRVLLWQLQHNKANIN